MVTIVGTAHTVQCCQRREMFLISLNSSELEKLALSLELDISGLRHQLMCDGFNSDFCYTLHTLVGALASVPYRY